MASRSRFFFVLALIAGQSIGLAPLPAAAARLAPARPTVENWNLTAPQIAANCKAALAQTDAQIKRVLALKGKRTFSNTLLPLENAEAYLNDKTVAETFLFNVATDKTVRDASLKCGIQENDYFTEISARPDLYAAVNAVKAGGTAKTVADKKLLQLWLVSLQRSGAGLSADKRAKFVALSKQLTDLQSKFAENLSNDATTITITQAQTAGLPEDFIATLKKNADGTYTVPVNEATTTPFMTNATDETARKTFYLVYNNRAATTNTPLLEQAITVRDQLAHLLGYPNWASYVLADRMAQTPQRVTNFLSSLDTRIKPRATAELQNLAVLKAQTTNTPGATINPWDTGFYDNLLNKTKYAVDQNAIRQYFPVQHTIDSILNIYHTLLGVTFIKSAHPNVWNSDVLQYDVFDTKSGAFIGTTYFDLYPRPGKYEHFANFPILPVRRVGNTYRAPIAAIVGNWPRPAAGHPALLTHEDVVTFFHEFGHNLAALLTTAPYETLSAGFRTDFVEAPSQMLENFMWQPSILKQVSSNVDTGKPLPDDLIKKMIAARFVDNAYFTTRQIMLATVDMDYHTMQPPVDTTAVWSRVASEVSPMPMYPGTHPQASFGHLMGGYDAGYYGYLWSKVYAQDMFTAFKKGGLENPVVGMRYRKDILQPARTLEPDQEVTMFLGRPMNPNAFYEEFGISGTPQNGKMK